MPGAPTSLAVTSTTTTNVALSWTAPSGSVSGYYIYQAGVQVGTSATAAYVVTGLVSGTAYTFKVAAYNANGTGAQTSGVVGTTLTVGSISGGNVIAPSVLPGNLLTIADSDFETGSPTWAHNVTNPNTTTTYTLNARGCAVMSSADVGSSQMTISGFIASARAMATRWRCPPESWLG